MAKRKKDDKQFIYPEIIYVQKIVEGEECDILAWDDETKTDDGEVAVYQLQKLVNKITETILTDKE